MNRAIKRFIENMVIGTVIIFITTIQIYYFNPFPHIQPNYKHLPNDTIPLYENVMAYNTSKQCITTWKSIFMNQNTKFYKSI